MTELCYYHQISCSFFIILFFDPVICRNYKVAADIIRKHQCKIITMKDLPARFRKKSKLNNSRQRMYEHIEEILNTGAVLFACILIYSYTYIAVSWYIKQVLWRSLRKRKEMKKL